MRRVAVTGMGAVSPLGLDVPALMDGLYRGESGIRTAPGLEGIKGLRPRVAGLVEGLEPKEIPRSFRRAMSRMSLYSAKACREALDMAGVDRETVAGGRLGLALGSTMGSVDTMEDFFSSFLAERSIEATRSTTFFKVVGHSCAANTAQYLGVRGRVLAPSAACATACQAVILGGEAIACGAQDMMLCGGADEFNALTAGTFDIFQAASHGFNDSPARTPRPFDKDRDGIVCSEGAGVLLLEAMDSALKRGAEVLAEVVGHATSLDPQSIATPDAGAIADCMRRSLDHAGTSAQAVDYVNAHATGTVLGDAAEAEAVAEVFGGHTPVSSLKGHLGHTMAACGGLELAACVEMMKRGTIVPTLNLDAPDPRCGGINLVRERLRKDINTLIKNNFALGGINACLVLRRFQP